MQPHFTIAKEERKFLLDAQLEFKAHRIYATVLEDLFEHHYEWDAVNNGTAKPKVAKVTLDKNNAYSPDCELAVYDFHKKGHHDYRLLNLEILLKSESQGKEHEFNYRILIKRFRED
jgi:hypothetical protein